MIIRINNKQESIACQKYLFKNGYRWLINGKNIYDYNLDYIITYEDTNTISFSVKEQVIPGDAIDFNIIMRENKLKRIFNGN